ncbi:unnamed protein product [Adineta steineri]|uniref:Uncharacterized protein n=1 Tax=Adineta steineri TaxID=433720 RepID=A0A815K544_9BILA|nr:unnamed protein product [Adineta steineri]CAF1611074.1 unnamed protein product [Adineta steineri]
MNFQPNEQPTFVNNDTSICFNDEQPNNPLLPNIESRFSPTANLALDSHLINELIDFHQKSTRKGMIYCCNLFGILFLIGLVLLIIGFVHPTCSIDSGDCSSTSELYLIFGGILMGFGIVCALIGLCMNCCCIKQQFEDVNFSVNGQQPVVWRLDGEQWVRYLNYMHGPNRIWMGMGPLSCFCCRRSTYERLMNRQHGHIILHEKGLIIDELYFVSFRAYKLQGVEILYIEQYPQIIGLRIHTYVQTKGNNIYYDFDLFAPPSVSVEQIRALARAYIIKIPSVSALDLPLEVIHIPESILFASS